MPVLSQNSVYNSLLNAFSGSSVVGKVPADGARFGIVTGSAAEYARFGTAIANAESGFNTQSQNLGDPGGSFGIFQYAHTQVPNGNAFDPNASIAQFVSDTQSSVNGGSLSGGILGQRFSTIGSNPIGGLNGAGALTDASALQSGDLLASDGSNLSGGFSGGPNLTGGSDLSGGFAGSNVTGAEPGSVASFSDRFGAINPTNPDATSVQTESFNQIDVPTGPDIGTTGAGAGSDVTAAGGGTLNTGAAPDVSATGSGATSGGTLPSGAAMINPVAVGFQQSLVSDVGGWIANAEKAFGSGLMTALQWGGRLGADYLGGLTNWFVRAGLILLGIALVFVGVLVLMWDHGGEQATAKVIKYAAA